MCAELGTSRYYIPRRSSWGYIYRADAQQAISNITGRRLYDCQDEWGEAGPWERARKACSIRRDHNGNAPGPRITERLPSSGAVLPSVFGGFSGSLNPKVLDREEYNRLSNLCQRLDPDGANQPAAEHQRESGSIPRGTTPTDTTLILSAEDLSMEQLKWLRTERQRKERGSGNEIANIRNLERSNAQSIQLHNL